MSIFDNYQARYESIQHEEMSLKKYLQAYLHDPMINAAERMLNAIGESELVDTSRDPRLKRIVH